MKPVLVINSNGRQAAACFEPHPAIAETAGETRSQDEFCGDTVADRASAAPRRPAALRKGVPSKAAGRSSFPVPTSGRGFPVTLAAEDEYYVRLRLDHREVSGGPLPEWSRQSWQRARPTVVSVGTTAYGLTIYELTEYVEVERVVAPVH